MQTLKEVAQLHRFAVMQPAAVQARQDAQRVTPFQVARHLRATRASSIGDTERLANVITPAERQALWFAHRDHFNRATPELFDVVMADCHRRIARAVNGGTLSLWPQAGGAA